MAKNCDLNVNDYIDSSMRRLRSAGVRLTKARMAFLQELAEIKTPMTARELFDLVSRSKRVGSVDQVTVYRILEKFEEFGLVHRVSASGGYLPCFHQNCSDSSPHILIHCSTCDDTSELDVPQDTVAPMLWYLKGSHGFTISSEPLQLSGICAACS